MPTFAILARNIGNLGHTSGERVAMRDVVSRMNQALGGAALRSAITGVYRHTGNFILAAPDDEVADALRVINEALDRRCAIVSIDELESLVSRVPAAKHATSSTRWTPGLALLANGTADVTKIRSTENAELAPLSAAAVAVHKRDLITSEGTLDRTRRLGGWGAIAAVIEAQAGGLWTARSLSTVGGLIRYAVGRLTRACS